MDFPFNFSRSSSSASGDSEDQQRRSRFCWPRRRQPPPAPSPHTNQPPPPPHHWQQRHAPRPHHPAGNFARPPQQPSPEQAYFQSMDPVAQAQAQFYQFLNNPFMNDLQWQQEQMWRQASQQQAQQQEERKGPPPASAKALRALGEVTITADDLKEEGNQSCLICLEDQEIGGKGCKLPCGHLFCTACIKDWLQRNCTCPSCRFELETEDSRYEAERTQRMKMRKQRYRPEELRTKTLKELKIITKQLDVNINGCIEKADIVQRLLESGKIQVLDETHMELSLPDLESMPVGELRKIMLSLGISLENCLEKSDMIAALSQSNRVTVTVPIEDQGPTALDYTSTQEMPQPSEHIHDSAIAEPTVYGVAFEEEKEDVRMAVDKPIGNKELSLEEKREKRNRDFEASLNAMGVGDLKKLMVQMKLSSASCLEKGDMVRKILEARDQRM